MRKSLLLILLLTGVMTTCSTHSSRSYVKGRASMDVGGGEIDPLRYKYKLEMGKEFVRGTASSRRYFIFLRGDYEGISEFAKFVSYPGPLKNQISPASNIAAARAMEKASADGLYITAVKVKSSGLWPIWHLETTTVIGRPLFIKGLKPTEQEIKMMLNRKRRVYLLKDKLNVLDEEISIVRKAIKKRLKQLECCGNGSCCGKGGKTDFIDDGED